MRLTRRYLIYELAMREKSHFCFKGQFMPHFNSQLYNTVTLALNVNQANYSTKNTNTRCHTISL